MITNESEIRIALQAMLISVLALYGFWGCAFVVFIILLPWKPLLEVGAYLAQPIVDWSLQKAARGRSDKGIARLERELDSLLSASEKPVSASTVSTSRMPGPGKPYQRAQLRPLEPFKPNVAAKAAFQVGEAVANLAATLAIPTAIKNHVRNLPQGVFSNMDLQVEEVKFQGEKAEAYVRFKSPNVQELVIRQRYILRRSGDHWEVETRQPANGAGKPPIPPIAAARAPMHLT